MNQKDYMQTAIDLASKNVRMTKGTPFGAVIVKDGEIIASGANDVHIIHDPTAHAEIQAIRQACEKLGREILDDCELYASGEPCSMCLGAIHWAGFKAVYFAADMDVSVKEGLTVTREPGSIPVKQLDMEGHEEEPFVLWRQLESNTTK
ncbi:nucleoside deaminase [Kroppenstedtia pulmonis]|uniref:Nucleoside deaminase n=1 Tax=Kroppenstedtia pulmonis TaxID=1380685 RepID=A0A7D4CVL5_9BACL|nr:nucleoside deaminase [Kroppenstedtia pulmonis]QKG84357.1 nucleoside deaminase [Kroppenstedtia pulmonis]